MQTVKPLYQHIASNYAAYLNCIVSGNGVWKQRHLDTIAQYVKQYMPRGSGFDSGTEFDIALSRKDMLVFTTSYHAMNGNGYYVGWYDYTVRVRPTFNGVDVSVQGRDYDGSTKDYVGETFYDALNTPITATLAEAV